MVNYEVVEEIRLADESCLSKLKASQEASAKVEITQSVDKTTQRVRYDPTSTVYIRDFLSFTFSPPLRE